MAKTIIHINENLIEQIVNEKTAELQQQLADEQERVNAMLDYLAMMGGVIIPTESEGELNA